MMDKCDVRTVGEFRYLDDDVSFNILHLHFIALLKKGNQRLLVAANHTVLQCTPEIIIYHHLELLLLFWFEEMLVNLVVDILYQTENNKNQ